MANNQDQISSSSSGTPSSEKVSTTMLIIDMHKSMGRMERGLESLTEKVAAANDKITIIEKNVLELNHLKSRIIGAAIVLGIIVSIIAWFLKPLDGYTFNFKLEPKQQENTQKTSNN